MPCAPRRPASTRSARWSRRPGTGRRSPREWCRSQRMPPTLGVVVGAGLDPSTTSSTCSPPVRTPRAAEELDHAAPVHRIGVMRSIVGGLGEDCHAARSTQAPQAGGPPGARRTLRTHEGTPVRREAGPAPIPETDNHLLRNLAITPMKLVDRDDPGFLLPDWVVTRPRLTGICGSDSKQVFMDWGEVQSADNPMKAFFSLPQVLGHEVVADVIALGPRGRRSRGRRPRRAQPVAVVRPARRHADVPGLRGRRLQPVLLVRRRADRARHPHRQRRRTPTAATPSSMPAHDSHAVPGARRRPRRARGARRPVRGVAALDHPPPADRRAAR